MAEQRPRRAWAWSDAVLLAYRQQEAASGTVLHFGHSRDTFFNELDDDERERLDGRQPASCASLWHVPERGYVLVLESLRAGFDIEEFDLLAADLREGRSDWGAEPRDFSARTIQDLAGPLLDRSAGTEVTLGMLLGPLPEELAGAPVVRSLVPRATAVRGHRHFECLLVACQAGAGRLVDGLLEREPDVERVQDEGFHWRWEAMALVEEPVDPQARIAVRQDGRAACIDLEATSRLHDYSGHGGDALLREALPLVAERGSEARDFWSAMAVVGSLSSETPVQVTSSVQAVRGMRARIAERAALYSMLHAPERFNTWTHSGQLSSLLRRRADQDNQAAGSTDEKSERALAVADRILSDLRFELSQKERQDLERQRAADAAARETARQDLENQRAVDAAAREKERRALDNQRAADATARDKEREQREQDRDTRAAQSHAWQTLGYIVTLVGTMLAIVVLFTAIAAIPNDDGRAIDPLIQAAFITAVVGVGLTALAVVMALRLKIIAVQAGRSGWAWAGLVLTIAVAGVSVIGIVRSDSLDGWLLLVVLVLASSAGLTLSRGLGLVHVETRLRDAPSD